MRIHDADFIRAARRLYMTATPRIFADNIKDKAEQYSAELVSMDDELRYGPEFHHLSFGDAVERGLLTDHKALDSSKESSHSAVSRTLSAGIVAAGLIRSVVADGSAADGSRHGAAFSRLST